MRNGVKKIEEVEKLLNNLINQITNKYEPLSREVIFASMVVKKTIDILSVSKYVYEKYILTVQISLIRLLCDNCLAIESAILLGLPMMMNVINEGQRVNNLMIDSENTMSDGYLKKKVAEDYKGFDKLYKFASNGVHFSKQAMAGIVSKGEDGYKFNLNVGNIEYEKEIESNNDSIIILVKVIINMLKKVCNI